MKIIMAILGFCTLFTTTSCEEIVDVETGISERRLVVDASLLWLKETTGQYQVIRLTTTTGYYDEKVPVATGARISVTDSNGDHYKFTEDPENPGNYYCDTFNPKINETYDLTIEYLGDVFTATEKMYPVPDLLYSTQEKGGIDGNGEIIKAFFIDSPLENFYMHQFIRDGKLSQVAVFDDEFVNGNETFTVRFYDELRPEESVFIQLMGISERYYDYMGKILVTVSDVNVGPFATPPAQLRGNIINTTNPDRYAFGYFRLSEVSQLEHISK